MYQVSCTMRGITIFVLLFYVHLTSSSRIPADKTLKVSVNFKRTISFGVYSTTIMRIQSDVYFRSINNDQTIISILLDNVKVSVERQNGHIIQLNDCPDNAAAFQDFQQPYLAYHTSENAFNHIRVSASSKTTELSSTVKFYIASLIHQHPMHVVHTIAGDCPIERKVLENYANERIVESGVADITNCERFRLARLQSGTRPITRCFDNICSPDTNAVAITYINGLVLERYGHGWAKTFANQTQIMTFTPFINKNVHAYSVQENRIEFQGVSDLNIVVPKDCTMIINEISPNNRVMDPFCQPSYGQQNKLQDLIFLNSALTCQFIFWKNINAAALRCYL